MKKSAIFLIVIFCSLGVSGQTNITLSNPDVLPVLLGNYNPAVYTPAVIINHPDSILNGIINRVSKDTLIQNLLVIDSKHNHNSGSDTVSDTRGIGAVRRWIFSTFNQYSASCENRLLTTYMDFTQNICGQMHHRNVLAVLPGLDTTNKEIMLIEGHFDTRCEGACDTSCYSPGMEDNGSGTVLVMELARIMSRYSYNHTIVFACVTGEDQGLYGSSALSAYLKNNNVKIRSVMNNDVIGGVICGQTSSPPGCPGLNSIDSTHVRVFSFSSYSDSGSVSPHKQLARYIRLHQEERINPLISTPMTIDIIISEDRTGRSGDHIPFRQKGYTAIRFTSRNEHGNGTGTPPDRQHSVRDILGVDTSVPPDGIIDSFYVNPNYLRRNIIMNGVNLGWLAIAPPSPHPEFTPVTNGISIHLSGDDSLYQHYRVSLRTKHSGSLYFDTVYTFYSNTISISGLDPHKTWYFSVANVKNGVESLFSDEYSDFAVGMNDHLLNDQGIRSIRNIPNPFTDRTTFTVETDEYFREKEASLVVSDLAGRKVVVMNVQLSAGINRVEFINKSGWKGVYPYRFFCSGTAVYAGKMVMY
ncbi:MAG: M28 family peptidase [Bacteroidetes bacterium]|nr:M28 family peptidase [Bacteroidota bacterium]